MNTAQQWTMAQWAQQVVNRARMKGEVRAQPCEGCGRKPGHQLGHRYIVAHHDDYAKPLDVRWFCRSCHGKHHAKHGPGKNRDLNAPRKAV